MVCAQTPASESSELRGHDIDDSFLLPNDPPGFQPQHPVRYDMRCSFPAFADCGEWAAVNLQEKTCQDGAA